MTINIRDATEADLTAGSTVDFDMAVIVKGAKGNTQTIGTKVLVQIQVDMACDLTVFYAANGPDGTLTWVDRGTLDKLVKYADFRAVLSAVGTNIRLRVKNISSTSGGVVAYTTIL